MVDISTRSVYNIVVKWIKAMKKQAFFTHPFERDYTHRLKGMERGKNCHFTLEPFF